ncbi:laminin subunit alpha-like isoform X2 [Asterias amurensis]
MCDQANGQCSCRSSFRGRMCEQCAEGFYNFPACEECNCDPAGVVDVPGQPLGGCGSSTGGACLCKDNVQGRTCDTCEPTFWNLQISNPDGCERCDCNPAGTINGMGECDMLIGQCLCKALVAGRTCAECRDGTFGLMAEDPLGCRDCGCDVGGSSHGACDKTTGQCVCKPRVTGIMCNEPLPTHYFPDLFQHRFEIEGGTTPANGRLRVGFDENEFPGFSYLAYAVMSAIQPVVIIQIEVTSPSLYHLVLHYVYRGESSVRGTITVTPSDPSLGSEQSSSILFTPGRSPQLVTVEGGGVISPFVLNPGVWTVTIEAPEGVLLDYLVLIPSAYYEATILQQKVSEPCIFGVPQERCNYYTYPIEDYFYVVRGVYGYYEIDGTNVPATQFLDQDMLIEIGVSDLAVIDSQHKNLLLNVPITEAGEYIFVTEYFGGGPGVQTGSFEVSVSGGTQRGYINFFDCSFLCRAVIVDADGMPMVFNIDSQNPYVRITLDGSPDLIGISQVIAIPASRWSYDIVTPALQCVRTADGQCHGSTYPIPPHAVWIDKSDIDDSAPLPPNILDQDITLHYITTDGSGSSSVNYDDVEPLTGRYVYVVHYFQPGGATVGVNFNVLGEFEGEGTFQAGYCPHVSGCRAVVDLADGSSTFDLTGNGQGYYISVIDGSEGEIWIDYVIAVPEDVYTTDILEEEPQDRAGEFIRKCGGNNFYISPDGTGFCRQATFSLSADYNNGALPCECNRQGSLSFNCDALGGQCQCQNNIAGRRCDRCKIGYYDFPNCYRCSCRSGVCNEVTGECICPNNVVGDTCDRCQENTFGYDPLVGCAECDCNGRGIVGGDYNCHEVTGQCGCKPNVGGRKCDQCEPGHHRYPFCESCYCDTSGTEPGICNQDTAECECKENVAGEQCNQCKEGTFYLQPSNTKGCINCFCFGHSTDCRSYGRPYDRLVDMEGWTVTNVKTPVIRSVGNLVNVYIGDIGTGTDPNQAIYWEAPESYLGNKLTSYGGKLEFTVQSNGIPERGDSISVPLRRPEVIISGNNITIMYTNEDRPQNGRPFDMSVDLVEDMFQYSFSARTVTREDMMVILAGISSIQIRAQYYNKIYDASLSNVAMDVTKKDGTGSPAFKVERCRCPTGYTGLSCEKCSPGFRRSGSGPYLGTCEPCDCNGHSPTCDPETGRCYNCEHNTEGDNCELCKVGYFGEATSGAVDACNICSCPYPDETRNYAFTCSIVPTGMKCECLQGHIGERCDICEEGYFGEPSEPYGFCRKCECSGNTNPSASGPECDTRFGNCLQCKPGTTGPNCNICAEWFYGDAVISRNCQECDCDRCGTRECAVNTGRCECKDSVVGALCDRCAPGTWNFSSCAGCSPCNCAFGAESNQCDMESGQCECKPGVGGTKCDQCLHGHWNYGFNGCQACECEAHLRCDSVTGECLCPPGATGDNCEECEDRYVLTDEGCQACDECTTLLLDKMDELDAMNLTAVFVNVTDTTVGIHLRQKLDRLNRSATAAQRRVDDINDNNFEVIDGFMTVETNYSALLDQAIKLRSKSDRIKQTANETKIETLETGFKAKEVEREIRGTMAAVKDALDTLDRTPPVVGTDNSRILEEAKIIVAEIAARDFSDGERGADEELAAAEEVLMRVKMLRNASNEIMGHIQNVSDHMQGFVDKLQELIDKSHAANNFSDGAEVLNDLNRVPAFEAVMLGVEAHLGGATGDIDNATALIEAALKLLQDAQNAVDGTSANSSVLDAAVRRLEPRVRFIVNNSNSADDIVDQAMMHAADLKNQSDYLKGLLVGTLELSRNALKAVNAYGEIIAAIDDADAAATMALNASTQAEQQANSFGDRPTESLKKSRRLVRKANTANEDLAGLDSKLSEVGQSVGDVKDRLDGTDGRLAAIRRAMANIPDEGSVCDITVCPEGIPDCKPGFTGQDCDISKLGEQAQDAVDTAMDANAKATRASNIITNIKTQLPELQTKVDQIPLDINAAVQASNIADDASKRARDNIGEIRNLDRTLTAKHADIQNMTLGLQYNLEEIKRKIANARTIADGVKVAMKFQADTAIELRQPEPEDFDDQAAYTSSSLFFKTQQPDALLYFIGGPSPEDDYYSLGVENHNVVLRYNLGDGDEEVVVAKDVNDYKWHEVITERNGRFTKVIVKGMGQNDVLQDYISAGDASILNFNQDAHYFVGGIPPDIMWLPSAIPNRLFQGGIDEFTLNGRPMTLWNFDRAIDANEGILRNDTVNTAIDSELEGTMFNGKGYILLSSSEFNARGQSSIKIIFKTYQANGLLFFMGSEGKYLSIELKGGRIQFEFDLGTGPLTLITDGTYNNGEQTAVRASMSSKTGRLSVESINGEETKSGTSPGDGTTLSVSEYFYLGGLVAIPEDMFPRVTRIGFRGCLREVTYGLTSINPLNNLGSIGIYPNCIPQIAKTVSFNGPYGGYISRRPIDLNGDTDMIFKFRTSEPDGVMVFSSNADKSEFVAVLIYSGYVHVVADSGSDSIVVQSNKDGYNDGEWHTVSVSKRGKKLTLIVDDVDSVFQRFQKRSMRTDGYFLIGGFPRADFFPAAILPINKNFIGCISDLAVRFEAISFSDQIISDNNANLNSCPIGSLVPTEASSNTTGAEYTQATIPTTLMTTTQGPKSRTCALPRVAGAGQQLVEDVGAQQFGITEETRLEFPPLDQKYKRNLEMQIEVKTAARNGLIMFTTDTRHIDYTGMFMRDGKFVFGWDYGSGPKLIESPDPINDGNWHTVKVNRVGAVGEVYVDGVLVNKDEIGGANRFLRTTTPIYLGGVDPDVRDAMKDNKVDPVSRVSFVGCLRNFLLEGVSLGDPVENIEVQPCTGILEPGVFFGSDGGYVKQTLSFTVGQNFDMRMSIKPRVSTAILMSVQNPKGDFLSLEVLDGVLFLTAENGDGPNEATYTPPEGSTYLCDGNWHDIQVLKEGHILQLIVDGDPGPRVEGTGNAVAANTKHPLYFGGLPDEPETIHQGISTNEKYVGCMRDITIEGDLLNFKTAAEIGGDVSTMSCPAF